MKEKTVYLWLCLVLYLAYFFGAYLLESIGIKYVSEGGFVLFKIHVYSYILIAVFINNLSKFGVSGFFYKLGYIKKYWLSAMGATIIVMCYGLYRFGTSGMAYMIDTIFTPLILISLVISLDESYKESLMRIMAYLIFINSLLAISEFVLSKSIIPVEFSSFSFFRSTAFMAHPLNNALITATLAYILSDKTRIPPIIYVSIALLALFCFGGRGSMGAFMIGLFVVSLPALYQFLTVGVRTTKIRLATTQLVVFICIILVVYIVMYTGISERILSKLYVDNSAQARFDVFILLDSLSMSEWFFGASRQFLDNIFYISGVLVVENFFIDWILKFGLPLSLLLIYCLLAILMHLTQSRMPLMVMIGVFILASVTNNSLSVKTPAILFLMLVLSANYQIYRYEK
ncbi:TPA: VpsF family polysaccharide biosynthesis protein [Vibrio cholerae]